MDSCLRRRAFYDKRISQEVDGEALGEVSSLSYMQQGSRTWGVQSVLH